MAKTTKMLMTAAVVMTSLVGVCSVESANVVGYQDIKTDESGGGKCLIGATFSPVGGGYVKLGDIKANEFISEQDDVVRIVDNAGGTKVKLYWFGEEVIDMISEISPESPIGWYDADFWDNKGEDGGWDMDSPLASSNDFPLAVGEALMMEAGSIKAGFVFAGEVDKLDIEVTSGKDGKGGKKAFRCNCSPVDLKLGKIVANDFVSEQDDVFRLIDRAGGTKVKLYWFGEEVIDMISEISPESPIGWYDADFWDNKGEDGGWDMDSPLASSNDYLLATGKGIVFECGSENAGFIIPSPISDAEKK